MKPKTLRTLGTALIVLELGALTLALLLLALFPSQVASLLERLLQPGINPQAVLKDTANILAQSYNLFLI